MLISDNLPVRKSYFDSNIIARILQRFFFLRIILKRTLTEAHVYMWRHLDAKLKHSDASNLIYHKFSHGAVYYTLNGENVNVMLELNIFGAGLEKLTNANRSVITINDRLLPVELTEIANWTSFCLNICYVRISDKPWQGSAAGILVQIPLYCRFPYFLNICLPLWMFYQRKENLNMIKIIQNFCEQTRTFPDRGNPGQILMVCWAMKGEERRGGQFCEMWLEKILYPTIHVIFQKI